MYNMSRSYHSKEYNITIIAGQDKVLICTRHYFKMTIQKETCQEQFYFLHNILPPVGTQDEC
jgi:hypothetical protein